MGARFVAVAAVLTTFSTARADDAIPGHTVDTAIDRSIIVGTLPLIVAPMALPVRDRGLWNAELFGELDDHVHGYFSQRAATLSDVMVGVSLAAPVVYLTGTTIDDADSDRLTIYGETLAIDLALVQVTKYLVQRPRPYLYNTSAAAKAFARKAGDDARLSFYSSHAALSFGAAVSGAYLLGASGNASTGARMFAWGAGFAAAASTADLRMRAGRHFYSDVVIGAAVGIAVGYVVPALHATEKTYAPSAGDITSAVVGLVGGLLASELLPLHKRDEVDLRSSKPSRFQQVGFAPMSIPNGAGLALAGTL